MSQIIANLYYLFLMSFMLPSGSICNIPVKLILIFLIFFSYLILYKKFRLKFCCVLYGLTIITSSLFLWSIIGFVNNYDWSVYQQLKSFASLLVVVAITWLLYNDEIITADRAKRYLFLSASMSVLVLLLVELFLLLNFIEWNSFKEIIFSTIAESVTTAQMTYGNITIYRIFFSNAHFVMIVFSFYLFFERSDYKKLLIMIIVAMYVCIVFSRVIIVQYIGYLLIYIIMEYIRLKSKQKLGIIYFLLFVLMSTFIVLYEFKDFFNNTQLYAIIEDRFWGSSASYSDDIRVMQTEYLVKDVFDSPFFGHGVGAYVVEYFLLTNGKYLYEAEYLGFIYQFGFIGFCAIILNLICIYIHMFYSRSITGKIFFVVSVNFFIFLIKPFFNPAFLSSMAAANIVSIFLLKESYRKRDFCD